MTEDWKELYEKALLLAIAAHKGATYGTGKYKEPYINHPIRVAFRCKTKYAKIAALLHDVVEDTDWTVEGLIAEGFPSNICNAIDCLTKRDQEDYIEYIHRVKSNSMARTVKYHDLQENMSNLETLRECGKTKWADKLEKRYEKAYDIIR